MKHFTDFIDEMAVFCRDRQPENLCIFGITPEGLLVADEVAGIRGACLQGEFTEQIQFCGSASRKTIAHTVWLMALGASSVVP
jgi:hypothetical protein